MMTSYVQDRVDISSDMARYRQHCAQRKPPVFKLLSDFEVFAPQGRNVSPMRVKFGTEEWTDRRSTFRAKFYQSMQK